tara:strand:+ start:569 stop:1480 length:912 start_codon:yes stop_codon:yes gene_type:complete
MKTVIIFGGSGFVGKHLIRRIVKNGYKIIVPHQKSINEASLKILGDLGQIIPIKFKSFDNKTIIKTINSSDVVINLKTQWDEKKISYKNGILDFNIELVDIIKKNNKKKQFIYFSGIGIDDKQDSARSSSIYASEQYIEKNLSNSTIIRPGVIIGGGDNFLKSLIPLFKISFFIPLFGSGAAKFQPVFIDDVSLAVNKIVKFSPKGNQIFEFTGNEIFSYSNLYSYLAKCMNKTRVLVPIPLFIVKIGVSMLSKTPFAPLTPEQLRLFESDNIASNKYKSLQDLQINPQDLKEIIKKIIKKHT